MTLMSTHRPVMTGTPGLKLNRSTTCHSPALSMTSSFVDLAAFFAPAGSNALLPMCSRCQRTRGCPTHRVPRTLNNFHLHDGLCDHELSCFTVASSSASCRWATLGLCRTFSAGLVVNHFITSCLLDWCFSRCLHCSSGGQLIRWLCRTRR